MHHTKKLALSGIISSLSLVLVLISGYVPVGVYALCAASGLVMIISVIECGFKYSLLSYTVVSILSLILVPNKITALCFVFFFGCYPVLKAMIEKYNSKKLIQYVLKFIVFNASISVITLISFFVLNISKDFIYQFGVLFLVFGLIVLNIIFFLYDNAISLLVSLYASKYHAKVSSIIKGK